MPQGSSIQGSPTRALVIGLRPTTPWRIGPDSGDRDRVDRIFHSDSLFSAVSQAMAQIGDLEAWLNATARSATPAVRLSSLFPSIGDTRLAVPPRHLWPPVQASSKIRWKGARFVPLAVIRALLEGRGVREDSWLVDGASECLIPQQASSPYRVAVRSAAAVDRCGEGVAPHSVACLEFAPEAGLWALATFADEAAREQWRGPLMAALRLLGDSGLGGERSRGWGRAEVSFSDEDFQVCRAGDEGESAWWLLSLYHPTEQDGVDWSRGQYTLLTRGGRIESRAAWGTAKRSTRMVSEGSVVVAASAPTGQSPDVAPEGFEHPVYRCGHAVALRVPWKAISRFEALPTEAKAEAVIEEAVVEPEQPVKIEVEDPLPIPADEVAAVEQAPEAETGGDAA